MTVKGLQDVLPDRYLGHVTELGPDGLLVSNSVEITRARFPKESILASGNTHAYIVSVRRDPRKKPDQVAMGVEDAGNGEALVGFAALGTETDIQVDPDMVNDGLDAALTIEGFRLARLVGTDHIATPDVLTEKAGFTPDDSGNLVEFIPDHTHQIQRTTTLGDW